MARFVVGPFDENLEGFGKHSNMSLEQECTDAKHSVALLESITGWLLRAYKAWPRIMAVACAVSAALLFLPQHILVSLALDSIVSHYRSWIALGFLCSLGITISYLIQAGWTRTIRFVRSKTTHRRRMARLKALDDKEKQILSRYISNNVRSQYFDFNNGTVANLILCGILYHPLRAVPIHKAPTTIAEWAWDYLHEHPDLIAIN